MPNPERGLARGGFVAIFSVGLVMDRFQSLLLKKVLDTHGWVLEEAVGTPSKVDAPAIGNVVTPEKAENPMGIPPPVTSSEKHTPWLKRKEQPPRPATAFFDFAKHVAFFNGSGGVRAESSDLFSARPEIGNKSPMMARFLIEGQSISMHVAGIWAGALEIGNLPAAPVVRIWKPKAKRIQQSWDDPRRPHLILSVPPALVVRSRV